MDSLAGPQTQSFGYDALYRLTSASATGGSAGLYNETYTFDSATGTLASKAGTSLTYNAQVTCSAGNRAIPHAVSAASTNTYNYDCNGSQTTRLVNGQTYTLGYDADCEAPPWGNRLVSVTGPSLTASFVYDGDGRRVKSTINGVTATFVGTHYEVTGSTVTKYYFAGAQRVAVRTGSTLQYLLGDHLGSTSLVTSDTGALVMETRYCVASLWDKPCPLRSTSGVLRKGEVRFATAKKTLPTRYTYTGQYSYITDDATDLGSAGFGPMFYNARWYDPTLGRFAQADSILPSGIQGWDRYAYVNNSPIRYTDPSGHSVCGGNWYAQQHAIFCGDFDMEMGITFSAGSAGQWSQRNKLIVRQGVWDAASKEANEKGISPKEAFQRSRNGVNFTWGVAPDDGNPGVGCDEFAAGGCTASTHQIYFLSLAEANSANKSFDEAVREAINNVVHELGHSFGNKWYPADPSLPYDPAGPYKNIPPDMLNGDGFYPSSEGASLTWQQHPCTAGDYACPGEIYADMYLGWVYDQWADNKAGAARDQFMTLNMIEWLK